MSSISTDGMDKWLDDAYPDLDSMDVVGCRT